MSDLISRGKLFNLLAPVQTLGEAYGIIQGMETVDAVPVRHGHWVYTPTSPFGFMCSECGKEMCRFNYCPNCGADMRENGDQ